MIAPYLASIVLGFLVAAATGTILSSKRAAFLPGGSFAVGLITGYTATSQFGTAILCGLAGIGGWIIYRIVVRR